MAILLLKKFATQLVQRRLCEINSELNFGFACAWLAEFNTAPRVEELLHILDWDSV